MGKLEYVVSGLSHVRVNFPHAQRPEIVSIWRQAFQEIVDGTDQDFSVLYNAYTEPDQPSVLDHYRDIVHSVHADSGGLQMITLGKQISPEMKKEIYLNQAKNSDIAMCFDEIPLEVIGEGSKRGDLSGRFFNSDLVEEKARKTGRNLKEQIELFLEEKSSSKPMLIAQGNCRDSFRRWTDFIVDELPTSYIPHIGGVAMSAATHGYGIYEDIQRAAWFNDIDPDISKHYFHLLGVGSAKRLLTPITFMNNGFYSEDMRVSYDSTSHTGGMNMGKFFKDGSDIKMGKVMSRNYDITYADINDRGNVLANVGIDLKTYHKILNSTASWYKDEDGGIADQHRMEQFFSYKAFTIRSTLLNFLQLVDGLVKDKNKLLEFASSKRVLKEFSALTEVKNITDYEHWDSEIGKNLAKNNALSKPIQSQRPVTLESLFG